MGLGQALVFVVSLTVCNGLDMTRLEPYNLTAAVMFIVEDLDQDGVMTIAEVDAVFDKYDSNHDGRVSRKEYTTFICESDPVLYQLSHYLYDDYDINHDHHLDLLDFEGFHLKMDEDGDGAVVEAEFVKYWVALFVQGGRPLTISPIQIMLFVKYESMGNHDHGHSHEHGASNCHI